MVGPLHVFYTYHVGQLFCPLAQSDVAVCFACIGSEFLLIVVGLPCLKNALELSPVFIQ